MFFKKLFRQTLFRFSFGLLALALLNACSEGDPTTLYESLIVEFNDIQSMLFEPGNTVITTGDSLQLTVTGKNSQGDDVDLTEYVSWSVSDDNLARVQTGGLMDSFTTDGLVTITASLSSFSATHDVTLSSAALSSINVKADTATPDTLETSVCRPLELKALGNYDDTTTRDITDKVTWTTTTPSAILKTGNVISLSHFQASTGALNITATLGSVNSDNPNPVTVEVVDDIDDLVLSPLTPTLNVGETETFQVLAVYGSDIDIDISSSVSWTSSDPTKADFNSNNEVLTAALNGTTTVTAVCGDQSDNTLVTIEGKALDNLIIEPDNKNVLIRINQGDTRPLTVWAYYSDATDEDVTDSAEWSADPGSFISVNNESPNKGLVTADAIGDDQVKATFGGLEAVQNVTVQ